ncbi:hypothetical protein C1645_824300 [Glomus cerebriforme]|uniref:Uncharacterized protein n=1 Tax=Glomus cerebriforme TaxID=658196 RepID=A0A397T401_9GLOM|nr:hypothetical protein C1645_824300 [Glomus cerebriforme]
MEKINDNDEDFQNCIAEIKYKIGIMDLKRLTNKAFEDIGEEATGHADYAIIIEKTIDSSNKELICIIEEKEDQAVLKVFHITLTEDILEDDVELHREVKKVMEVIIGLLKDRVEVDDSPDSRRAR